MKKTLFFLLFTQLFFSQQYTISNAERTALVNIYNATSGNEWSQTWDFEKDPRHWYGIKIQNGNVIEINLRGNALKGSFPVYFSTFSKLKKLDLSSNQLTGEISNSVSSLTDLVRLDISNNRLTGDPAAATAMLINLEELSLGNNQFVFNDVESFLQNFPNLRILDLAHTQLLAVPQKISGFPKLQSLNLSNNTLSQNFSALSTLLQLTELNLSGTQLIKIPVELSGLPLVTLDVSNNAFAPNYSMVLSNMSELEWLSLENNQLTALPRELAQLKKLVHLNLSGNKITGGFDGFSALKNLEQLYLNHNQIEGNFPAALLQLDKLQMLSLTGNQLTGEIPENIPQLTFLENNRFSQQDIRNFMLKEKVMAGFSYSPQRYDEAKAVPAVLGSSASLPQSLSGNSYEFSWFKNLDQKTPQTTENYHISKVEETDYTAYTCEAYYFEKLPKELLEISFFREPVTLVKQLGTEEIFRDLIVYPNPTSDYLTIRTTKLDIEKVYIFDLSGKLLFSSSTKHIDVRHLPSATYIISIKTYEGVKSFKFIKH
ncbi:Two component regulator three Y domain protein [Flavobacteriaceae bacterium 3519-10]|nr:Two component regulator three Y domain protein [Flavobacteriaceae bacterium 3519-10]